MDCKDCKNFEPKEVEVSIKRLGNRIKIVATKPGTTEPVWVYIPMSQAGEVAKALQMLGGGK